MLSHLPARDVVSSMRVSRTFRDLIQTSPTLQRNIFLRPQKGPSETLSFAGDNERTSNYRRKRTREYKIATLCPLLHMDRQTHLTVIERFESEFCEVAVIDPCAVYADSYTQMYLTNPLCIEVDIELVYKGTARKGSDNVEKLGPEIEFTLSATRTVQNQTGVTFDMLMEANHERGHVRVTTKEQVIETDNEGTREGEPGSRTISHTLSGLKLHELVRGWERSHPGLMRLDLASTEVKLHGVIIHTAADFAAIEKADREAKMEEEQRKIFQAVLLELNQKMAGRAACETVEVIEKY